MKKGLYIFILILLLNVSGQNVLAADAAPVGTCTESLPAGTQGPVRPPVSNITQADCQAKGTNWSWAPPDSSPSTNTSVNANYQLLSPLPCPEGSQSCEENKISTYNTGDDNQLSRYLNTMLTIFIGICAVLAMIMIVIGGLEYMTSELPGLKEDGKNRITQAILGLLLALGAWLILYTINPDLLTVDLPKTVTVEVTLEELPGGSYSSTGGAGGSCTTQTDPNNACSPAKLASSCFGNRANDASKVCNVESGGGRTNVPSGSDKLNNGTGPSYSIGLWQINLTVNDIDGLGCPSAFSGKCGPGTATQKSTGPFVGGPKVGNCSVIIKDQALYDKCVAAAKDPVKNTQVACRLYGESGNSFKPWGYTANKCSVPLR